MVGLKNMMNGLVSLITEFKNITQWLENYILKQVISVMIKWSMILMIYYIFKMKQSLDLL